MKFETIAVHAGGKPDPATGAIAPPIHLSTTFEHGPAAEHPRGYLYIRDGSPTEERLEEALAAIEGGEAALVFSSGMAAGAGYLASLPPGSHVLFADDIYYAFREMANDFLSRWGIESSAVDMADLEAVRRAIRGQTRLLWGESPSNPLMKVADLAALSKIARDAGALFAVDGTFATPVLQRPLSLGADVVLHAATKYLGGHSDVQGGALVFARRDETYEKSRHTRHILGAVLSPFNSWLVLRGLRSLACRVEHHSANALAVARAIEGHPSVEAVHYPGLSSDPGHEIAKRQMTAFGGMLSFRVKGGRDKAVAVCSRMRVFTNATSLGGTESLIEHRASSEGPASTTPQNLLRCSIGLEHPEDLIEDLMQALA
ncbi:MAG TPA: aminotransferase class I/II-fold pyridoxal phosphate-dependent enzyme [Thermoanaerobaculia bacterium]|nr:aminotransferase class I/II-fold pyridoxal phosphate-dependent enzyme [Thermoanaerobaculia bacterium]